MIGVEITEDVLTKAKAVANGKFTDNGNLISAVGAVVVADYYGVDIVENFKSNSVAYDMLVDDKKIYVGTKQTKWDGPPRAYFEASVNKLTLHVSEADYLIFVSLSNFDKAYIMGGMDIDEFLDESSFLPEGAVDPTNGYKNRKDCLNIAYEKLHDLEVLICTEV